VDAVDGHPPSVTIWRGRYLFGPGTPCGVPGRRARPALAGDGRRPRPGEAAYGTADSCVVATSPLDEAKPSGPAASAIHIWK